MCGRIVQPHDIAATAADTFAVPPEHVNLDDWLPGWNVKPTQRVLVAAQDTRGLTGRILEPAIWWLTPSWAKQRPKFATFNARSETALTKATFRGSAQKRCILPVAGYYEWKTTPEGKQPHYIHPDQGLLNIAGLYTWWRAGEDQPWTMTCTVLTRAAEHHMTEIHDRMPVMVQDSLVDDWLDPATDGKDILPAVSETGVGVADRLALRVVAPLRGDGPELIAPQRPES